MENRIDQTFAKLRAAGQKAFIAYLGAGDPTLDRTVSLIRALEKAGVDLVEIGLPFSDPLADGIVNQLAAQRALEAGATVPGVLQMIRQLRASSEIPLVLYTYLNPIYRYGFARFFQDAAAAGIDGILLLDLPPEEDVAEFAAARGLRRIRLIAPTTPPDRVALIARRAEGFLYYVSREGVTGAQTSVSTTIGTQVAAIRLHTHLPIAVGFGISTPDQAREVAYSADAVVVGSAIVKIIGQHGATPHLESAVETFVLPLVAATKSAN